MTTVIVALIWVVKILSLKCVVAWVAKANKEEVAAVAPSRTRCKPLCKKIPLFLVRQVTTLVRAQALTSHNVETRPLRKLHAPTKCLMVVKGKCQSLSNVSSKRVAVVADNLKDKIHSAVVCLVTKTLSVKTHSAVEVEILSLKCVEVKTPSNKCVCSHSLGLEPPRELSSDARPDEAQDELSISR
jgi:hypothetical protein